MRIPVCRAAGIGVRSYLTALVLPLMLALVYLAVFDINEQLQRSADAQQVQSAVIDASNIIHTELRMIDEFMPAMGQTVVRNPQVLAGLGTSELSMASLGLSDSTVSELRALTSADIAKLKISSGTRSLAVSLEAKLAHIRASLDSLVGLNSGYKEFISLVTSVTVEERAAVIRARQHLTDGAAADSDLADLELVATAAQAQGLVTQGVVARQFDSVPNNGLIVAFQIWSAARAATNAVQTNASASVAAAWRRAMSSDAATELDRSFTAAVTNAAKFDLPELTRDFRLNSICDVATMAVVVDVVHLITNSAERRGAAATRDALVTGALSALILLLSIGTMIGVRRRMSKPLLELADQARRISEGDLVEVQARGPLEVRTVADGLSAAVENLRKVAAQAAAVASGNLTSDVVRQPLPGALGAVMHQSVSAIVDAINARDAAQSDLAHRAAHDALTELPNRAQAMSSISKALHRARRNGAMTSVMFVDLDRFKMVNDTFGHAAGDQVLQISAHRMQSCLRAGDEAFRLGGDEFAVLLEGVASEVESVYIAQRMIEQLSQPIDVNASSVTIGASIGIAYSRDASIDADRLLSDSDAAMYRAKQSGRGRVGIFDDGLRAELHATAELEAAISAGIENDEFVLHYQPIVCLIAGQVVGFEALMRWQRPGHGLVSPDDFIPVAEGSVLVDALGRWALIEATAQLARWDAAGTGPNDTSMAVNISGRHLTSNHLLEQVADALDRSGIAPHRLVIEVTETVLVDNPVAIDNLVRLREVGVVIAIDDFGTGYTSISQLHLLPIDKLKIDRSFIASTDSAHHELVTLIVASAHAFGLTLVAEGIETLEQATWLRSLGVECGQGYLIARPAPAQLTVMTSAPLYLQSEFSADVIQSGNFKN